MKALLARLLAAWQLVRHPGRDYLAVVAESLAWPVPSPLIRDFVSIDTEERCVVYSLAVECPCGCGNRGYARVFLRPGESPGATRAALDAAAVKMLEMHSRAAKAGEPIISTEGMGIG